MKNKKGFTLIELLVVIAIVAVLSVVVILTLNPAELLKQARDSNRMADLTSLKTAIALYLVDSTGTVSIGASADTCYVSLGSSPGTRCTNGSDYWFGAGYTTIVATTSRAVNSAGWLPVNFSAITSGSPFSQLPIDPINNSTYYYAYAATTTYHSFKLVTNMESSRYQNGGGGDAESTDGGIQAAAFEVGSMLSL